MRTDILSEQELHLIWNISEEFRAETYDNLISDKERLGYCRNCLNVCYSPVLTRDGDAVCINCGLVLEQKLVGFSAKDGECSSKSPYVGYKHIFHFNEKIANLNRSDPRLPADLLSLVQVAARAQGFGPGRDMWYGDVRAVLRSIVVPDDLQEKYRSKRYKFNPLTDMEAKFAERWITLRWQLTGKCPPYLDGRVIQTMQVYFQGILIPFRYSRHKPNCDGRYKCHKEFGCNYKFPPYNFIIKELLFIICGREVLDTYAPYLLHTHSQQSLQKIHALWDKIAHYNRWPRSYVDNEWGDMERELMDVF
jgi:hypothetical protein